MALLLFLHSGKRSELISRMFFKPYGTEREIQSLRSVKVQRVVVGALWTSPYVA